MYFKQITVQGLGCLSYVLGCPAKGEMIVVDPKRDVADYLDIAREEGMRITRVIDTHTHADHVSGAHELRSITGCEICMHESTAADFPFTPLAEGDVVEAGAARLEVLHTPGHTPNSISLLVTDKARSEEPWMLLTGDLLFVGDVGRPDLVGDAVLEEQVKNLHTSLFTKLGRLPDHLEVFPAHGAGSLCGRGMSSKPNSTLGFERRANPAFRHPEFEDFRAFMTQSYPSRPKSFSHIIATNRAGAPLLDRCPVDKALTPEAFQKMMDGGAVVIDTRDVAAFGGFHIPGALNIGFEKQLANWVGMVVAPDSRILLVTENRAAYDAMGVELHRIGYDNIYGYLAGSMSAWLLSGRPVEKLAQLDVREVRAGLTKNAFALLDVRTAAEAQEGRIEGAEWMPLDKAISGGYAPDPDRPVVVYCRSGYRANIVASHFQRQGHGEVLSMAGGVLAWTRAGYPLAPCPACVI
ncbi:MAG: MBL fold metallo-hydrolase [Desulfovibrionaceae bacterium]|nr:MBL fold metallo-hydrolase [Desulfovibrionaceae bacterium]